MENFEILDRSVPALVWILTPGERKKNQTCSNDQQIVLEMTTHCSHPDRCNCDNYREELNGPHIVTNGNCINCNHAVNLHPRRPTGKCPNNVLLSTESITALTYYIFLFSFSPTSTSDR